MSSPKLDGVVSAFRIRDRAVRTLESAHSQPLTHCFPTYLLQLFCWLLWRVALAVSFGYLILALQALLQGKSWVRSRLPLSTSPRQPYNCRWGMPISAVHCACPQQLMPSTAAAFCSSSIVASSTLHSL